MPVNDCSCQMDNLKTKEITSITFAELSFVNKSSFLPSSLSDLKGDLEEDQTKKATKKLDLQ